MFFVLVAITDDTLQEQFESFYVHVFISDTAVAVTNDLGDGHERRKEDCCTQPTGGGQGGGAALNLGSGSVA